MDKIDFVIMWVDGSDPKWLKEKKQYSKEFNNPDFKNVDNAKIFRDWGLLPYWFRGVEKFAPWVNKIHFVTYGHIPKWLNTENPKINIVKHSDFMPKDSLPTYNARALEINLHRIKGLSENFVFFNDDFFIINNVKEEDFFVDGKPCDCAVLCPVKPERHGTGAVQINDAEIVNDHFNGIEMINKNKSKWFNLKYGKQLIRTVLLYPFKQVVGFYEPHLPVSFKKKTYEELWDLEEGILKETTYSRFRSKTNVNQWLFRYWQLASGDFCPRRISFGKYFDIYQNTEKAVEAIKNQKYNLICLNDSYDIIDIESYQKKLAEAFDSILSEPSSFEKKN